MTWISVEDRLPGKGEVVLVSAKAYRLVERPKTLRVDDAYFQSIVKFDSKEVSIVYHTNYVHMVAIDITHWMPLPEPPKE